MSLLFVEVRYLIGANESFHGTFVGVKLMKGLSAMIESSLVSVVVLALWFMEMSKSLGKDIMNRIETIIIQYNHDNNISSTIYLVMEYGAKKMDWPNSI
eukprot:scaffold9348_cov82-Cyclotella_meneghiniana.AAC.4